MGDAEVAPKDPTLRVKVADHKTVVPEDDDFLRDVEPQENERRQRAYVKAKKEAEQARRRQPTKS